jgi:acyl carrier protein
MLDPALEEVLTNTLGVPVSEIDEHSSMGNTPKWDSLPHVMLLGELEANYGIRSSDDEMTTVTSIARIRGILRERGLE